MSKVISTVIPRSALDDAFVLPKNEVCASCRMLQTGGSPLRLTLVRLCDLPDVVRLRDIDVTTSLTSRPHGCSWIKCSCLNGGVQHGGSGGIPNSQPKTTRNTLPVHLLQNNSGKFVVFAFGRCSRHFIVFSRRKTSCARRGNLPPPISSLQNQLKLKQLPDLHTCILQDSFPGKFNSSWVIRNNFTLHLS